MNELVMLRKMGFSVNFPRKIVHAQKSALGIGLMKPTTTMAILALKLCVGHKRKGSKIAEMTEINEENAHAQHGYEDHVTKIKDENEPSKVTWSKEIGMGMKTTWQKLKMKMNHLR